MPKKKQEEKNISTAFKFIEDHAKELVKVVNKAKEKYENMDPKTKKKVVAGIAGSIALIASAIGAKKMSNKKK